MEEDLIAALLADAGLAALVADRIKWNVRAQGSALPAIVLQLVSAPRRQTFSGRETLVDYLVQMDVWATSYASVLAIRRALLTVLDGLTAAPFQSAFPENERDSVEAGAAPVAGGTSPDLHRASLDVRVWHRSAS